MKKYLILSMSSNNKITQDDMTLALCLFIFAFIMCMIMLIGSFNRQQYIKTQTNIETNVSHKNWTSDTSWTKGW